MTKRTYYCPRGCQSFTTDTEPGECGACGAPFSLDRSSFDETHQYLEDADIERFVRCELDGAVFRALPNDVERALRAVTAALAANPGLFAIGRAYGVTFGCSPLVKSFLIAEHGMAGCSVASNMFPMK